MECSSIISAITASLFCSFFVVNLLFYGFCVVIYKCFRVIQLFFLVLDSTFYFLNEIVKLNHKVVSLGLNYMKSIGNGITEYCSLISYTVLNSLTTFIGFVLDLPFLSYRLALQLLTTLFEGFNFGILSVISGFTLSAETIVYACKSIILSIIYISSSILLKVFTSVTKAYFIISCWIASVFTNIGNLAAMLMNSTFQVSSIIVKSGIHIFTIIKSLFSAAYDFFAEVLYALRQCFKDFEQFIIMPFSLENIGHLTKSIWSLSISVITIPIQFLHYLFKTISQVISIVWMEITLAIQNLIGSLLTSSMRIILIGLVFATFVMFLMFLKRRKFHYRIKSLINKLLTLMNIRRSFRIEEERNVIVEEERMPAQNTNVNNGRQLIPKENVDHTLYESLVQEREENVCVICLDLKRNILLLPCRHLCLCHACVQKVLSSRPNQRCCPLCKDRIKDTITVFI